MITTFNETELFLLELELNVSESMEDILAEMEATYA